MKKIPVNIITGFLGAGKTTAIIEVLKQKDDNEKWAVIINEFGKVSIDFITLEPVAGASENVFEISGGCICCSAQGYFQENLKKIVEQGVYDRIIIEPSGLGGIEMVSDIVKASPTLHLMPVVCLIGITTFDNPRMQQNPIFKSQIAHSNILILSKCDLESENKQSIVMETLKNSFPNKLHYSMLYQGELDQKVLEMANQEMEPKSSFQKLFFTKEELQDKNYQKQSFTFNQNVIFDSIQLKGFFIENKAIIRAKGYIQLKDEWCLVNYTMGEYFIENCSEKQENKLIIITEKEKKEKSLETEIRKLLGSTNKDLSYEPI